MSRKHVLAIALLVGAAFVAGVLALSRTVQLGATAKPVPAASIAARSQALDRLQASIERSLTQRPPARRSAQRVVYVRPQPIVIHKHRSGAEHEAEGGGFDD